MLGAMLCRTRRRRSVAAAMSAWAICTWGDGPDVLVSVSRENTSGFGWVSYQFSAAIGSFGLTVAEARKLAAELLVAVERAESYTKDSDEPMASP